MTEAPEYLTVKELADLLRIKERKVYDLASAGDVPCTRATGKLLFPTDQIRQWIDGKKSGTAVERPAVFLGSHDPLMEWALRQSQCGLATFFDGSSDGVARFKAGEGVATGLHIREGEEWNIPVVARECAGLNAVLIAWATRRRGLVFRRDDRIEAMGDVTGRRVALRQPHSGTAVMWESLLSDAHLEPSDVETAATLHSEQDAVLAVTEGSADVTFGLESVARQFGLGFTPLVDECFDILVDRRAYFAAPFQDFLAFCRGDEFRMKAQALSGYDLNALGEVRWNA